MMRCRIPATRWFICASRICPPARAATARARVVTVLRASDDARQVPGVPLVDFRHPHLPAGLGGGDDLEGLLVLLAVLRQELGGSDEQRGRQAGGRGWALLDQGEG